MRTEVLPKITIVEDDYSTICLYEEIFYGLYTLQFIQDYEYAFDFIKVSKPDLVIIDLTLPGEINGLDVIKKIREEYSIPIIVITASDNSEDNVKSFENGANDYIIKPVNITYLKKLVRNYLKI